jgi:hypothetical protein
MKKLKLKHLVLIIILLIFMGFMIGQLLPIKYLNPDIVDADLTINDLWERVISLIGTIVTFLAVVVALFKEDIRQIWDKAELTILFRDETELHEILDNESSSTNYIAKKYEIILLVKNNGTLAAKNCEIFLERLQFNSSQFPTPQDIILTGQPLRWHNNPNTAILIPATGKATVSVVEIISPQSQSVIVDEANTVVQSPKIRFSESELPIEYANGVWTAKFIVYSENAKPIEKIITVTWNNKWENRLSEMKRILTVTHK